MPRPLQVNSRAARHRPSRRSWHAAQQRVEIFVGGAARRGRETARSGRRARSRRSAIAPVSGSAPCTLRTRKSPRPKWSLILVDHLAHVQPRGASSARRCEAVKDLLQLRQRRLAAQFEDHVSLGLGDDQRAADRAAALADDGAHAQRSVHQHGHGAAVERPCRPEADGSARAPAAAGHAADDAARPADLR